MGSSIVMICPFELAIDQVHHRGQGRRFSAARRPRHEDKPLFEPAQVDEHFRKTERFERGDRAGDGPEDGGVAAVLLEDVDPEPAVFSQGKGEVYLELLFVDFSLLVAQDIVDHVMDLFPAEDRCFKFAHLSVDPHVGRLPRAQVEVRCLVVDRKDQEFRDVHEMLLFLQALQLFQGRQVAGVAETEKLEECFRGPEDHRVAHVLIPPGDLDQLPVQELSDGAA